MATIQDIMDWLNQGAQGDIPGTGQQGAAASASADQALAADYPRAYPAPSSVAEGQQADYANQAAWKARASGPIGPPPPQSSAAPSAQEAGEKGYQAGQKAGQGLWAMLFGKQPQKTPQDYTSDIPPTSLMHYQALVSQGIPPDVARYILTQPSLGEGESPAQAGYSAQSYAGEEQDKLAGKFDFPAEPPIGEQMWGAREAQQQNLPVAEGQTQGSSSGLQRLPTGQYVPYPSQGLDYWAAQGNPSSFYWNPQPGSSWLNDLLGDQ